MSGSAYLIAANFKRELKLEFGDGFKAGTPLTTLYPNGKPLGFRPASARAEDGYLVFDTKSGPIRLQGWLVRAMIDEAFAERIRLMMQAASQGKKGAQKLQCVIGLTAVIESLQEMKTDITITPLVKRAINITHELLALFDDIVKKRVA